MSRTAAAVVALLLLAGCNPNDSEAAIRAWFQGHEAEATEVARCESGLRHDAVSPGGSNVGTMQINRVHRRQFEEVTGQPFYEGAKVAWFNVQYARWLFDRSGWDPWTCQP